MTVLTASILFRPHLPPVALDHDGLLADVGGGHCLLGVVAVVVVNIVARLFGFIHDGGSISFERPASQAQAQNRMSSRRRHDDNGSIMFAFFVGVGGFCVMMRFSRIKQRVRLG